MHHLFTTRLRGDLEYLESHAEPFEVHPDLVWLTDDDVPADCRQAGGHCEAGAWKIEEPDPDADPPEGLPPPPRVREVGPADSEAIASAAAATAKALADARQARERATPPSPDGPTLPELEAVECPEEDCACDLETVCQARVQAALAKRSDPKRARKIG